MGTTPRDLLDFLEEAELSQYYSALSSDLKITTILQLKYVEEDDLIGIGMTKPEMRRLKRHYKKECPQGALGRLKKAILSKTGNDGLGRSLSPSPPENRANRSSSRLSSYIRPPSKQIIPADSIQVNKTLGEGEFGVVQQGVWTTETGEKVQVAIKCLSKERLQNGTTEFLKEAGIMQTIDHENIVRMFGVVLDKENTMMLVTELAPMRSLLECLKEQALRLDFPLPRLCDFAQQICDGMTYLESKRLIHRDLAVRNILVFSKNKVKISDFGLSRALGVGKDYYQSNFSINLKLPIAWCAPECINYLKFTSASDVWAFGVTMWELFSYGLQPWASMTGQQILEAIDTPSGQRLDRPDLCPKEYYDLMCKCWDHDTAKRPTFSDIYTQLPFMRPVQMKALKDFPEVTVPRDFLYYKASDIIYVIDKTPVNAPSFGLCRGVLNNGKAGFFDPVNCTPIAETKPDSPITSLPKPTISRKESKRSSSRKLRAEMISGPKNDLRHTGHIGYDGAVFGDVSFIGDNYDKLPVNVGSGSAGDRLSSFSLHRQSPDGEHVGLNGGTNGVGSNGLGHSWISQESIDSTFKDENDGDRTPHYQDIEDDSLFADFKMPDIGSSFDFGGSFMDEVLKALNEKEAKLEASSPSDSTPSPDSQFRNSFNDRSGSVSPPSVKEFKHNTPPPLPAQPPRSEIKKEPPKPEPRKQAKVKPMSASEEKMMDDAIALANECAVVSSQNQTSETPTSPMGDRMRSDSESGSDSPKLISKLKNSFKRSPKLERKRTFSEEIANKGEITEDVPPEAQEAYNILVVRGSVKEDQRKERPKYPAPVPEARPSWESRSEKKPWESSKSVETKHSWESSRTSSESKPSWEASRNTSDSRPPWETTKSDSRPSWEPKKTVTNSVRSNVPLASTEEVELFVDLEPLEKVEPSPPRPVPKPRVEIPKKYEPPVPSPKQRPEIHRVEPVPRPQQPPPRIPMTSAVADLQWDLNESFGSSHSVASNQSFGKDSSRSGGSDVLRIQEDRDEVSERTSVRSSDYSDSDDPKRHSEVLRIDLPDSTEYSTDSSSTKELHIDEGPRRDSNSKSSSLFDEEFSEPSPREIMNKLARESRIRRSLDHQRGVVGDMGEPAPNRNLREPQGIPGKSMPTSNGDDEEVDTNPLRMLRGGAIPIRGGRAGQGNARPPNRPPKLPYRKPQFHHSMSVDSGSNHVQHVNISSSVFNGHEAPDSRVNGCNNVSRTETPVEGFPGRPPAIPPRSYSVSGDGGGHRNLNENPLPLPPRTAATRSVILSTTRERKYPLILDDADDCGNSTEGRLSSQSVLSSSSAAVRVTSTSSSSVAWAPAVPARQGRPSDLRQPSDLPPAPLLPTSNLDESSDDSSDSDDDHLNDSVFENDSSPVIPRKSLSTPICRSGSSTFPRVKFRLNNKNNTHNLEQLGFYNRHDPFWVKSLILAGERISDREGSEEISPIMLANYKTSDGVSYEDLLDFALDRYGVMCLYSHLVTCLPSH